MFVCLKSHSIIGHVFGRPRFLLSFSSRTASLAPPTASPTLLTGVRVKPCATPLWGGQSGHLAGPIPNTGYEPKFCIAVDSEHTAVNLPTRNMSFPQEYDATIAASEDLNLPPHFTSTFRSIKQQPAYCSKQSSSIVETRFTGESFRVCSLRRLSADYDSVASRTRIVIPSRTGIKETCADTDRQTVVSSLFGSLSKEKRDRDQNVVQTVRGRISTKSLNGKLHWP